MANNRPADDGRVLFGESTTSAFLSLAAQEGLLVPGVGDSDRMFEGYRSTEIPIWLRRQISQQTILFPEVVTTQEDYHIFSGSLLDEGILKFSSPNDSDSNVPVSGVESRLSIVATEAVLGLLAISGVEMTADQLIEAVSSAERQEDYLVTLLSGMGIQVGSVLGDQMRIITDMMLLRRTKDERVEASVASRSRTCG